MAKKKPLHSVRLLRAPTAAEPGILCLKVGKTPTFYAFQEIPCDIGGRGFAMHRLGVGVLYHVRVGRGPDCTCECLGFLRHGHCKHVLGLRTLIEGAATETPEEGHMDA